MNAHLELEAIEINDISFNTRRAEYSGKVRLTAHSEHITFTCEYLFAGHSDALTAARTALDLLRKELEALAQATFVTLQGR